MRALILQVEPGLDASIVDERIETWRGRPLPAIWHTTLTEKAAMECEGILEKDDAKELLAAVRKRAAEKQASTKAPLRPRATRAPRKLAVADQLEWTGNRPPRCSRASAVVASPRMCHYTTDGKVRYPNSSAPYSHSASWNNRVAQQAALFRCLRWAWTCHEASTGESCPYDLD